MTQRYEKMQGTDFEICDAKLKQGPAVRQYLIGACKLLILERLSAGKASSFSWKLGPLFSGLTTQHS